MTQFVAVNVQAEVNGETVYSIIDGMGSFKAKAIAILEKNGIKDPKPGMWFKQQAWLDAFKEISTVVGNSTLYTIGLKIPENAQFPPQIDNIEKALSAIDIAYHMNHRVGGKILFDGATGKMSEGIGHYVFKKISDREIKIIGENPYPCDFDRGIIEGMARKFKPAGAFISIAHDAGCPCRKTEGASCTYTVKW